jgi:hypothetical protein
VFVYEIMDKKVFISYSWDSQNHKEWVRNIADELIKNGVEVKLDQYDMMPGDSFTHFMEKSITEIDNVLVILTPNYREKSVERKGGVGYEQQIISGEIMDGINRRKFIPIIRSGKYENGKECAIPPHFKGIVTIDFRSDDYFSKSFDNLIRTIYERPIYVKPQKGDKPDFLNTVENEIKVFQIQLDKDYRCIQSEIVLTDILFQMADLRKLNKDYKIEFYIENITELYSRFSVLKEKTDPTESEIRLKHELMEQLNSVFFLENGTVYDYFKYSINLILDYSYHKYKLISKLNDLYLSVVNCLSLFSDKSYKKGKDCTVFDVFHRQEKWNFKIFLPQDEVNQLLIRVNSTDMMMLQGLSGLDTHDLMQKTIIEMLIPKQVFSYTLDHFYGQIDENLEEKYMNISGWRIGLA